MLLAALQWCSWPDGKEGNTITPPACIHPFQLFLMHQPFMMSEMLCSGGPGLMARSGTPTAPACLDQCQLLWLINRAQRVTCSAVTRGLGAVLVPQGMAAYEESLLSLLCSAVALTA
jgi:hypothetical protein